MRLHHSAPNQLSLGFIQWQTSGGRSRDYGCESDLCLDSVVASVDDWDVTRSRLALERNWKGGPYIPNNPN